MKIENLTIEEKLEITNNYVRAVNLLNDLFDQADEDTPQECRTRHFLHTMSDVEEFLLEIKERTPV